jgi:hypothetical protein
LQRNRLSTDDAGDLVAHDDLAARDHSRHLPYLADDDLGRLDIAFDLAVDLQDTPTDNFQPLTNDLEVVADNRFLTTLRRTNGRLLTVGASRTGCARLGCFWLGRWTTREHEIPKSADEERAKRTCRAGVGSTTRALAERQRAYRSAAAVVRLTELHSTLGQPAPAKSTCRTWPTLYR